MNVKYIIRIVFNPKRDGSWLSGAPDRRHYVVHVSRKCTAMHYRQGVSGSKRNRDMDTVHHVSSVV